MAEIVNLRRVRKAQAKADAEQQSARNRSFHGLPRAEKERLQKSRRDAERHLDQHRLEPKNEE